ncbi:hypothetical protein DL546_006483 [Coniochaeta pulveracea]|uniref:Histone chaperone domain-containing protein n=1 Tax=Coniochaeta pulveracea TaxID=177199 RepID=A0A420YED7_9PEZI|nr:hypothetical protein DL546_006483 [Coniochaeta pulveracea]
MAPKKEVNTDEAPSGIVADQSYTSSDQDPVPVVKDDAGVEDPLHNTDDQDANSDAQLERDDKEAIDESNIIDERTRGAKPISTYKEPGDTEGLPEDTGRSAVSTTDQALGSK